MTVAKMLLLSTLSLVSADRNLSPVLGSSAIHLYPRDAAIPDTFLGVNILRYTYNEPVPPASIGAWRSFASGWPHVEPGPGIWEFDHLDATVDEAVKRGVDLDLVLSGTTTWASARPNESTIRSYIPSGSRAEPADITQWVQYVRTVAQRYKGRVHTYELWNEPNTSASYSGDVGHLVAMCSAAYRTLKEIDPAITVVSPGFTPAGNQQFIRNFLTQGGAGTFDVFGYHFYTLASTPEQQVIMAGKLSSLLTSAGLRRVPIWNTESGYLIESTPAAKLQTRQQMPAFPHALSGQESSDFIVRAYVLGWALGFQRFYWFSWGSDTFALIDDRGYTQKPATEALENLASYLTGSRMVSCDRNNTGLWVARFLTASRGTFEVVWSDAGTQQFLVPPDWSVTEVKDTLGDAVPAPKRLEIDSSPLFFSGVR